MLGVVRVFNRKSAIILADVNSVMNAFRRFNASQAARRAGDKRKREAVTSASKANRISLQNGEGMARFDTITLPVRKKQKTSAGGGKSGDTRGIKSPSVISGDYQSEGSIMLADMSLGDSAEVDVLTAMETIFPSIVVPRLGEHLSSRLSSPSPKRDASSERHLAFRAREQDIALTDPAAHLDADIFQSGLPVSLHSNTVSNAEISLPMWDLDLGGTRNQVGAPASGSSNPSQNRFMVQEEGHPTVPRPDSPISFEPLQIEPLDLQVVDAPLAPATGENISEELVARQSVSMGAPSADDETGYFHPPQGIVGKKRVLPAPPYSNSTRRRRTSINQIDTVTELSPSHVRDLLRDTTDIVIVSPEKRGTGNRKGRPRKKSELVTLPVPDFLNTFSRDITDLWHAVAVPSFTVTAPRAASTTNQGVKARSRGPETEGRRVAPVPHPEYDIPMIEEVDEAPAVPDTVKGQRRASSLDIDRAQEGSKSDSNDQLSIPSRGQEGRSTSGSGQGGSGAVSSSGSGHGLANLIDKVRCMNSFFIDTSLFSPLRVHSSN